MVKPKFHQIKIGFDSACYPPEPNWQTCIMLSTRKPTKYSIRNGHKVEIAYFPPGEGCDVLVTDEVKEDIEEFRYVRQLTREGALRYFRKAQRLMQTDREDITKQLENIMNSDRKLAETFPELDPNRRKGTWTD